jgi:hypothetical protein
MITLSRRSAIVGVTASLLALRSGNSALAGNRLLLLDATVTADDLHDSIKKLDYDRTRVLDLDLVQQWRRAVRGEVASSGSSVALVRWDKAFILAGLAREERWQVRTLRVSQSLFRVEIAV